MQMSHSIALLYRYKKHKEETLKVKSSDLVILQGMELPKPKLHRNNLFEDLLLPNILVIYHLTK